MRLFRAPHCDLFLYYTPIFLICKYRFFFELSDNLSILLFIYLLSEKCTNFLFENVSPEQLF